ncbi:MAG: hypothetical protein HOI66_12690 [Verrucomicrobia bacterium]|nr:hypothetical protein [Verrucomicrobiota bacterium]
MMNRIKQLRGIAVQLTLLIAITGLFGFGCATFESTNWNERVGTYNIDDAKSELGAPDRTEDTADGGVTATWVQRVSYRSHRSLATGSSYDPRTEDQTGVPVNHQKSTSAESVLNLTFNDDGVLSGWDTSAR